RQVGHAAGVTGAANGLCGESFMGGVPVRLVRALVRAGGRNWLRAQESGDVSSISSRDRSAGNTWTQRLLYSWLRNTALSPTAFEQCPPCGGCAPTGPFRPPIGARVNNPSLNRRSSRPDETARAPVAARRAVKPRRAGLSGWLALERTRFSALTATPTPPGRPEGGPKSC